MINTDERFEKFIKFILKAEGGYVNDPKDAGGETKYGISKRAFPQYDIKNLTVDQAKQIYYNCYYKPCKADKIEPELLALQVFDFAVNAGISRAIKAIQRVAEVKQDGILGTITFAKLQQKDYSHEYIAYRKNYYTNLDQPRFIKGWIYRVDECTKFINK